MNNSAFEDQPDELSALLVWVALVIKGNEFREGDSGPIFETNGNKVGNWEVSK